jgi:hypothetical protein
MRGPLPQLAPWLAGAALIAVAASVGAAQPDTRIVIQEPLLGTWRLDLSKSKYSPGPPPRSETRTYARDERGVAGRIDRLYADGRREIIDYRADADRDSPVSGTQAYDAVRFRRIDAYTTEAVLSHAGRVWGTARRVLSQNGETLTIVFRRIEPGEMVNNVAVYVKEKK